MLRRNFVQSIFSVWPLSLVNIYNRPKYKIPSTLWLEDENGNKWIPDENYFRELKEPEGFIYQHSQFPRELHHSCCTDKGQIFSGSSSWSESLVLAMTNSGDYKLSESILIAANMCERCMNSAAYDYNLNWGYPRNSIKWNKANTSCEFCNA